MVIPDDVSGWFCTTFNADATLATLVPGDMVSEMADEHATQPYGVCTVAIAGAVASNSGIQCYPEWRLDAAVYADQNTSADANEIQKRMGYLYQMIPQVSLTLRNSEEYVLSMQPTDGMAKYEPRMRDGNDVVVCRWSWIVRTVSRTNVG